MYFRGYCPVPALVCVVDTGVFVHNFLNCFLVVFGTLSSVSGAKAFVEEVIHLRITVAACVGGSVDGLGTEELSKETVRIRVAVPAYAVAVYGIILPGIDNGCGPVGHRGGLDIKCDSDLAPVVL